MDNESHVWRLDVRGLSVLPEYRKPFIMHIVLPEADDEKKVVDFARREIHSLRWWNEHLIFGVTYIGRVWAKSEEFKLKRLRSLVDIVHGYCYENESVPSTETAEKLIATWVEKEFHAEA